MRGAFLRAKVDGDHATEAGHLPRGERVLRVRREPGVDHALLTDPLREPRGHGAPVDVVLAHAQVQRLRAAQHEPRVERPGHRARRVEDELQPCAEVVVVEDGDAADEVRVAVEVFGRRVPDDVGAHL